MLGLVETQSKKQPLPGEAIRYSFIDFKVQKVASDQSHFLVTGREFSEFELCGGGHFHLGNRSHFKEKERKDVVCSFFIFSLLLLLF